MADPVPQPAPDAPLTKSGRAQLRERMAQRREDRMRQEATIVASIVGGMSYRAVAGQLAISKSQVERIYKSHLATWNGPEEVRAELHLRLQHMLRAIWPQVVAGDVPAVREARRISELQAQLEAAHKPAPIDVNVSGAVTVRRELRLTAVLDQAARIRADQLERAEQPALPAGPSANGHGPGTNGSEAAA